MNTRLVRTLTAQSILAVAFCGITYHVVVGGLRVRLAEARQGIARQAADIAGAEAIAAGSAEPADSRLERWRQEAEAIDALCRGTADAGELYNALTGLADRFGVRIDQIDPRVRRTQRRPGGSDDPSLRSTDYTVTLVGEYEPIARFLDAVESELGLSLASSVRLTPGLDDEGRHRLFATIDTAHYWFDRSIASAAVKGEGGGP